MNYHPVKDNYKYFEKYIECKHKGKNEISSDCRECDIAWLIERCRYLEKYIDFNLSKIRIINKNGYKNCSQRDK